MFLLYQTLISLILSAGVVYGKPSILLKAVEKKYRESSSVHMIVNKTIKLKLIDQKRESKGEMFVQKGGKFRWETETPDHSLVLVDGQHVWLVDYPSEEGEKVSILKASNPKKSQPHAVVAFLLGEGRMTDSFSVVSEKKQSGDLTKIDLKPREEGTQVQWLTLYINKKSKTISKLSFEDSVENETELNFSDIKFNEAFEASKFKFTPPKGSDITVID